MRPRKALVAAATVLILTGAPMAKAFADASVTASNQSGDNKIQTGDAKSTNSDASQTGQTSGSTTVNAGDVTNGSARNVQQGDNSSDVSQSAVTTTGSAVGGQVIGGVVSGNLTVDAANQSTDITAETGNASSSNSAGGFVGLTSGTNTSITADISNASGTNVQQGDNSGDVAQTTSATSGDAVGGQVVGASTSGTADLVLANTSTDSTTESGKSNENSSSALLVGLTTSSTIVI